MMHCSVCGAPMLSNLSFEEIAKMGVECQFCYSIITKPIMRKALSIDKDGGALLPVVKIKAKVPPTKPLAESTAKMHVKSPLTPRLKGTSFLRTKKSTAVKHPKSRRKKKTRRSRISVKKTSSSKKYPSKKTTSISKSRKRKSKSSK